MSSLIESNSIETDNKCPSGEKDTKPEKSDIRFWSEDPNVLLRFPYIFEFFPTENMTYSQKMNAISRLILVLALVGFVIAKNMRLLVVGVIVLFGIYMIYASQRESQMKKKKKVVFEESFDPNVPGELVQNVYAELNKPLPNKPDVFDAPSPYNPFSNVLMTDYDYNPMKKPAPPSFNKNVGETILSQAKQMVIEANPSQPDIADKLFRNLGDEFKFEQSMRPFVSNPSTTIPNDQQAFADFCYGSMISSKEGNMFSLARNLARHQT